MSNDMCVPCDDGMINIRAGAIVLKNEKFLMVGNKKDDYLYSVGGRIKFGETAEEALVREVYEETGVKMEIDRLGFIHENYFRRKFADGKNKLIYEISFYFYMKTPNDFSPVCDSFTEFNSKEFLKWVSPSDNIKIYPDFFRNDLLNPIDGVKHYVNDER